MIESTAKLPRKVWLDGKQSMDTDTVVVECPVALVYNGISHVVMMATPEHLEDLALGFSLSEGILRGPAQLLSLDVVHEEAGIQVLLNITNEPFSRLKARRRNLTGRTGCGLCGIESLEAVSVDPPRVEAELRCTHKAIDTALTNLAAKQTLKQATGGVHAAAWCSIAGEILYLREDVGRHNALDKLLGKLAGSEHEAGFVLLTSRIGYEMVTKAAACQVPLLAAVSAPTSLAVELAQRANMSLVGFVQPGRQVVYCGAERFEIIS